MYEDSVTLYNIVNGIGYKTVFKKVHFEANTGVAIDETGMQESDKALCIIPCRCVEETGKSFVDYKTFEKMSEEERMKHFTFNRSDKFVFGEIDFVINNIKPNTIADLERNFTNVFSLSNYTCRMLGSSPLNHFEITGK